MAVLGPVYGSAAGRSVSGAVQRRGLPVPPRCTTCGGVSTSAAAVAAPQRPWLSSAWHGAALEPAHQRSSCLQLVQRAPRQRRQRQQQPTRALFTGIVQGKATVRSVRRQGDFSSLSVAFPPGTADGVQLGASVAINGTCLTVTSISEGKEGLGRTLLGFDVIAETLRATNLGALQMNSTVNFERSARMGDEIGGHHVSGHVHTTAALREVTITENNRKLTFEVPEQWMKYVLPKGFIAVDGCSLTVGEVGSDCFSVYLIPETLRVTILGDRRLGDAVNIEIDAQTQVVEAIVDTVEALLPRYVAGAPVPQPSQSGVPNLAGVLAGGEH